jgi:hypothetical protein
MTNLDTNAILTAIRNGETDKHLWIARLNSRKQSLLSAIGKIQLELEEVDELVIAISSLNCEGHAITRSET